MQNGQRLRRCHIQEVCCIQLIHEHRSFGLHIGRTPLLSPAILKTGIVKGKVDIVCGIVSVNHLSVMSDLSLSYWWTAAVFFLEVYVFAIVFTWK